MNKYIKVILFSVAVFLSIGTAVFAAFTSNLQVTNNTTTVYPMIGLNTTTNIDYMANNGFFAGVEGLDTRVTLGTSNQPHLLADDRIMFSVPVPANSSRTLQFTTGSSNLSSFAIVPGNGGYITTVDAANLEPAANFSTSLSGYFDSTVSGNLTSKGTDFVIKGDGSGNILAGYGGYEDFTTYTEVDAPGKVTVYSGNITATGLDADESVYVYKDYGAGYFDAIDWVFEIQMSSTSQLNAQAIVSFANLVGDFSGYGTTELGIQLSNAVAPTLDLVRGKRTAVDTYLCATDTPYWIHVERAAGNNTVTAKIYTDAAMNVLVDTLSVAGYGVTTWRYAYGISGINSGLTGRDWYGYVKNMGIPTLLVTASGVASGERDIQVDLGSRPDLDDWASDASVSLSMGAGMIPGFLLEEVELTADAASVTFSNIDTAVAKYEAITGTTARHLVVMVNAASPDAVAKRAVEITLNGDVGATYNHQTLTGENAVGDANRQTGVNALFEYLGGGNYPFAIPGTTYANSFGGGTILFPHAFNTANHKVAIGYGGAVEDYVSVATGRWASVSAITSLSLALDTGNIATGSTFQLAVVDERYLVAEDVIAAPGDFNFNGIPQVGDDLVLIGYTRSDRPAQFSDTLEIEFNGDAVAANYNRQFIRGFNFAESAANFVGSKFIGANTATTADANAFSPALIYISQYSGATNYATVLSQSGHIATATSGIVYTQTSRWLNVAAITDIRLYSPLAAIGFEIGSLGSLYRVPRTVIDRRALTSTDNVTFTVPQTYEVFGINIYGRSDAAALNDEVLISFNLDTTAANYDTQTLDGSGAAVTAVRSAASRVLMEVPAATEGANEFGGGYASFNQYAKNDRSKHGVVIDGTNENSVFIRSIRWESLNPITTVNLSTSVGTGFVSGTIIELIGSMPSRTFSISVDSLVEGIEPAASLSVPSNTENWTFFTNNVIPYATSINLSINGTTQLYYKPNEIITSINATGGFTGDLIAGNMTDRSVGVNNWGRIIWGGNPAGIGVSLGALVSDDTVEAEDFQSTSDVIPVITAPNNPGDVARLANLAANDPLFYPLFSAFSVAMGGMSILAMYWMWFFIFALILFFVIYKYTNNLLFSAIGFDVVIGFATAWPTGGAIYDAWVIIVIVIFTAGMTLMEGKQVQ